MFLELKYIEFPSDEYSYYANVKFHAIGKMSSEKKYMKNILIIGGHDPTSGAGITTDIRILAQKNMYVTSVISCLTIQNSFGVTQIESVPDNIFRKQIESIIIDFKPDFVKIGLIASVAQLQVIQELLSSYKIVFDPVLTPSLGNFSKPLFEQKGFHRKTKGFLQSCFLITPNEKEFRYLFGISEKEILSDALILETLKDTGLRNILVKSVSTQRQNLKKHQLFQMKNNIYQKTLEIHYQQKEKEFHGTGCRFASHVVSFLCKGDSLSNSIKKSHAQLQSLLKKNTVALRKSKSDNKKRLDYLWY